VKRNSFLSISICIAAILKCASAHACLHFEKSYKYELKQGTEAAFLFHDGKYAHLIIKTDLSSPNGELPKVLAWVMPFPTMPIKYEEVDKAVFYELGSIAKPPRPIVRGATAQGIEAKLLSAETPSSIRVHEAQVVGNYKIQPIEILSVSDGKEFNDWLTEHQFNSMPLEKQRPYLHQGAVFLAIKANLSGKSAELKPIHIVYPADRVSLPLRFTHDARTLDLDLFIFSDQQLAGKSLDIKYFHKTAQGFYETKWSSFRSSHLNSLLKVPMGYVTLFQAKGLNDSEHRLADLKEDPGFSAQDLIPPSH